MKQVYRLEFSPFADWLRSRIRIYGSINVFANRVQVDPVWMGKVLKGDYKTVELDKIDTILCRDATTHIREIYPSIYEEG